MIDINDGIIRILPIYSLWNENESDERIAFYESCDTSLIYTGKVHKNPDNSPISWYMIDLRPESIDVITLDHIDDTHPVGSTINDLCRIWYNYKHTQIIRPLTDIRYGTMMLADLTYFAWSECITDNAHISSTQRYQDALYIKYYSAADASRPTLCIPSITEGGWPDEYLYECQAVKPMPRIEVHLRDAFCHEFSYVTK